MHDAKDSKSRRTSKLQDRFKSNNDFNNVLSMIYLVFFGPGTSLLWLKGESAGEIMWRLALVTGGR